MPVQSGGGLLESAKWLKKRFNIAFITHYEPTKEGYTKVFLSTKEAFICGISAKDLDAILYEFGEFYEAEALEEIAKGDLIIYEEEEEEPDEIGAQFVATSSTAETGEEPEGESIL